MYILYSGNQIKLEWTVFRGLTSTSEDFSRATLSCMLSTASNRFPVTPGIVTANGVTHLSIVVPEGLPEGVYDILAVWTKNEGRSLSRSMRQQVFAVTDNPDESTDHGGASLETVLKVTSSAGTFGYDGLSAYEMALLKGLTTKDETTWVEEQLSECTERIEAARDEALDDISGSRSDAMTAINQKMTQGLNSIDAAIDEAATAIQSMQDSAISTAQSQINEAKTIALNVVGDARGAALTDITNAKGYAIDDVGDTKDAAIGSVNTAKQDALEAIAEAIEGLNIYYEIIE